MPVALGSTFPDFTLPDQNGRPVRLRDLKGPLVVYTYPEAGSPSCTKEACAFDAALSPRGVPVVGISPDPVAKVAKFVAKQGLKITLLADEPAGGVPKTIQAIGCWGQKSMYGKTYMGVIRTTYVLDAGMRVAAVWENVRVPGHDEQVMGALAALKGGGGGGGSGAKASGKEVTKSVTRKPAKKAGTPAKRVKAGKPAAGAARKK